MLDILELEVNSNCVEKVLIEGVLCVAEQQARLAHSAVADNQHFEQVVAEGRHTKVNRPLLPTYYSWFIVAIFWVL